MRETVEFRVQEKFADRLFAEDEGVRLMSMIRKVTLGVDDPKYLRVGELDAICRSTSGEPFFFGWIIRRSYSTQELADAAKFHLKINAVFEPAGEDCGTQYDSSEACPVCGSGAAQRSDLILDLRKAPRSKQIARTIAGEWIVAQDLAERMVNAGLTGFRLGPVRHRARYDLDPIDLNNVPTGRNLLRSAEAAGCGDSTGRLTVWLNRPENRVLLDQAHGEFAELKGKRFARRGKPLPVWHQLMVESANVTVVPPTRCGIRPFDEDARGQYRCPAGDLRGLNLLSEISVDGTSVGTVDVALTRQYFGARQGLLRPRQALLISQRFRRVLEESVAKGFSLEIAHLV